VVRAVVHVVKKVVHAVVHAVKRVVHAVVHAAKAVYHAARSAYHYVREKVTGAYHRASSTVKKVAASRACRTAAAVGKVAGTVARISNPILPPMNLEELKFKAVAGLAVASDGGALLDPQVDEAAMGAEAAEVESLASEVAEIKGGYQGGLYRDLDAGEGIERHHLVSDSVSPLSRGNGPAIQMDRLDHYRTASWGNSAAAQASGQAGRVGEDRGSRGRVQYRRREYSKSVWFEV
jgi:hypothetical protein